MLFCRNVDFWFYSWLQEFISSLEIVKPIDIMLPEDALRNVREVRLEVVKLSSETSTSLRVDLLGCAEGRLQTGLIFTYLA